MERVDYESLIIQDLINLHNTKALNLNPWYQRRSVWSDPQRAYLINTIFEQKPVPSIYVRHQIDIDNELSIKEVVDGQQRARTIIAYRNDDFPARHPNHPKKVFYKDLAKLEKTQFLGTALSVGYLIGATDQDVIEIFGRINSIAKTLNPQEKRNAQFGGDFKQFCLSQASERLPFWRTTSIFSSTEISRMQEVQFISDLTINLIEGLVDFNAKKIDDYYRKFDDDFPSEDKLRPRIERIFETLTAVPPTAFSDTVFHQYQVAFSLMLAIDGLKVKVPKASKVHEAMLSIDDSISTYREVGSLSAKDQRILDGFTGANLHRIKTRKVRDDVIRSTLA